MAIVYDQPVKKGGIVYDQEDYPLSESEREDPNAFRLTAPERPKRTSTQFVEAVKNAPGQVAAGIKQASPNFAVEGPFAIPEVAGQIGSSIFANAASAVSDTPKETREKYTYQPRLQTSQGVSKAVGAVAAPIGELNKGVARGAADLTGIDPERAESILNTAEAVLPAAKGLRSGAVAEAAAPKITVPENPVAAARAAGYKVRPSDVAKAEPETSVRTTTATEGLAGSDELRKSLMNFNQRNSTKMALQELGLPETSPRVTPKLIEQASAAPLAKYREVGRAVKQFEPSDEFHADLDSAVSKEGLHPDSRADIAKMVSEYKDRGMSGPDAVKSVSVLRRGASRYIRSDDPATQDFGFAQRQVADAIESQLIRQLEATGQTQLAQEFLAARQQLAKIHDVQSATKAGQVDIHVLKKLQDKGAPLSGRLAIMADTAEMFPHVTKHPQSVSNVSGGGAIPGVGPAMDVVSGGLRPLTRKFLGSDVYQNRLGKPEAQLGPESALGEYFTPPPAAKGAGSAPPPFAPEPGPRFPRSQASAMLEAQKRAGDLSLVDEVRNPQELPPTPSRLHAETPPAPRGGIPFKASAPDTRLGDQLSLAPDVEIGQIPGGQNPRAAGMSQQVSGTSLHPELRAVRGKPDEVTGELSLAEESTPKNGPPGTTITPNPKHPGFFDVNVAGKKEGVTVKGRKAAEDLLKGGLGDEFAPTKNNVQHSVDETGAHTFTTKNGEATAQEGNGYLLMKRSDVVESARGNGEGKALVRAGIEKARELGLKYGSDISVSPAQEAVYKSLEKDGVQVKRNPSERSITTGNLVSRDPRKPVFEIETSAKKKAVGE